jgi:alanine racemase
MMDGPPDWRNVLYVKKAGNLMPLHPLTTIEIDLDAIAANVRALKQHVGPPVSLFAVVKANAYGHGMVPVAAVALRNGADRAAVARIEEGIALREAGITAPILIMSYSPPDEIELAVEHDLTVTLADMDAARALSEHAVARGRTALVHIKVDTGLGRYGLLPDEVVPFACEVAALPNIEIEGLYSHFSVSDLADKSYTLQQFETFERVRRDLLAAGINPPLRHIAASASVLDLPDVHLNAVRPGIAMYGLCPSNEVEHSVPLTPALSLKSHVARVRKLPAGSSISYGRTYVTPREMPVALVPVGYGDGYHRLAGNRGAVLIHGQRAPILGRICMDHFVVDVSHIPGVALGDEIVVIGQQGNERISADEVASWTETINYEVTTSLLPRLPRVYHYQGRTLCSEAEVLAALDG